MTAELSTVRFRLAGWVGELEANDRKLIRDVRRLFYEPAASDEPANGSYRAFVDRRFGAEKRHWLRGPASERYLRITPFFPSLLDALDSSATTEAAAFQGSGRYPLRAGAVSGPTGALIVLGEGDGDRRPRLMRALAGSGFAYLGDGLVVVEPERRRLIPCARAIAITRPAHGMTAHRRGQRPFRNREREVHRYLLPEHRQPTGEGGACRIGTLLFVQEAEAPRIRAMSQGEALLGVMGHHLGGGDDAFADLTELVAHVPAYEVSARGSKRAVDLLCNELPGLAGPAGAGIRGKATG